MNKIFIILFFLTSTSLFAEDTLVGKKFICSKLFWGFDFFSSNKVNVISTNINNITSVKEYYYETEYYYATDDYLPYINILKTRTYFD